MTSTDNRTETAAVFDRSRRTKLRILGGLCCAGFAAHATWHILAGTPQDIIWVCNLSALLVGFGLILGSPLMNSVGLLGLTIGLPTWILSLVSGEPLIPTSLLTHVLGLALGIVGARRMGIPPQAWWMALLFVAAVMIASRLFTSEEANVNLAFGPIEGLSLWKFTGAGHWTLLFVQWAVGLAVVQFVLRRILNKAALARAGEMKEISRDVSGG